MAGEHHVKDEAAVHADVQVAVGDLWIHDREKAGLSITVLQVSRPANMVTTVP